MDRVVKLTLVALAGLILPMFPVGSGLAQETNLQSDAPSGPAPFPVFLEHKGRSVELERPAVAFDHQRHTKALPQVKKEDCGVCHTLKAKDERLVNPDVEVFRFPKDPYDESDKTNVMYAYHQACVGCHRKTASEGKESGPDIGRCGKCHVRKPEIKRVSWGWAPIFDYARHDKHVKALAKPGEADSFAVAAKVEIVGPLESPDRKCQACHHTYDDAKKKLIYKKDSENSCRACHKAVDEKNARSMKSVSHAACIGCHMKKREEVAAEAARQGRKMLTQEDKKRFGPFECAGCHGEHKELTPEEIAKIPRLVRGQKDVMDLMLTEKQPGNPEPVPVGRMKTVAYNHKAHEPRAQFCNTCHHHSLEKCSNCHTLQGDPKKGGGVPYERAFHKITADQACVGCHQTAKQDSKCAGCHQQALTEVPKSSCPTCHRGPSDGRPVDAAPLPLTFDKERVPEKLAIKILEKEFKPAELPHQKIVAKLTAISNQNSLARVFHASGGEQTLCAGCHHKSDYSAAQQKKVPQCSTCHSRPFNPADLGKPGILGAYHRQCIGCHEAMKQKPAALECVKCHPAKEDVKTAEIAVHRLGKRD